MKKITGTSRCHSFGKKGMVSLMSVLALSSGVCYTQALVPAAPAPVAAPQVEQAAFVESEVVKLLGKSKAIEASLPERAWLFCCIAVQKSPARVATYQYVLDYAKRQNNLASMIAARKVLELGMYQVKADDVEIMMALLDDADALLAAMQPSLTTAASSAPVVSVAAVWNDIKSAENNRKALELTLKGMEVLQDQEGADTEKALEELGLHASFLTEQVQFDSMVARLSQSDLSEYEWTLLVHSLNEVYARMVTIKGAGAAASCKAQLEKLITSKITAVIAEKIQITGKAPAGVSENVWKTWNDISKKIALEQIRTQKMGSLISLFPGEAPADIRKAYAVQMQNVVNLENKRHIEYQKWAMRILYKTYAFNVGMDPNPMNTYNNYDVIKDCWELAKIDLSILTPETRIVYDMVMETLKGKRSDKMKAACMMYISAGEVIYLVEEWKEHPDTKVVRCSLYTFR